MTKQTIVRKYIEELAKGNVENVIALFSESAMVHSPLYGSTPAAAFYRELGEDTQNSALKLNGIFEEENSNRLLLYFNYCWTLSNGKKVDFEVVDVICFDENSKITDLRIIYDTVKSRELLAALKG